MKVEVSNEKREYIDWDKPQLLVNSCGTIILTTINQSQSSCSEFCGVNIKDGDYSTEWNKKAFKPFTGVVTIKND